MRYKILYVLFIVTTLLYGAWHVMGPLSLRHIMTIIMGFICLLECRRFYFDKYLGLYFIFVVFWELSSFITGYPSEFFHDFVGYVVVTYVAYWATVLLKRKSNSLQVLFYAIIAIGLLDSAVTVSQAFNVPLFDSILSRLHLTVDNEMYLSRLSREDDLMGFSIPGIFESPVYNGHFLIMSTLFSLSLQKYRFRPIGMIITFLLFSGLFFCQQRAPFFLSLLLFLFVVYKTYISGRSIWIKTVTITVLSIVFMVFIGEYSTVLSSMGTRYDDGFSVKDDPRSAIYSFAIEWISNHPFGNLYELIQIKHPHNFFLNAFVYAGWIGGLFIIFDLFIQLVLVIKTLVKTINTSTFSSLVLAATYLGLTGNSMFHNISIVSGDAMTWITWAAFFVSVHSLGPKQKCRYTS